MIKTETKTLLIASFVPKTNIDWFFQYVNEKFNIKKDNIFMYEIENDDTDYLLTFKIKDSKKIDLKFYFSNATIVNIKNGCIFSINGLNRLIELEMSCDSNKDNNIEHKNYKINWELYKNKLILSNKNSLIIKTIKKITTICEKS